MEHAQKMFLVLQNQLDKLKNRTFTPEPICQTVENKLYQSIRNILARTDVGSHKNSYLLSSKVKKKQII